MSLGGAQDPVNGTNKISSVRTSISSVTDGSSEINAANLPDKVSQIQDEFDDSFSPKQVLNYDPKNPILTKVNLDPFSKTGGHLKSLTVEELANRPDVLASLQIMGDERDDDDVFSLTNHSVTYADNEANYSDYYASGPHNNGMERLDQESLIKEAFDEMEDIGLA